MFFFVRYVIEVYLCPFLGLCCLGALHNKCRCIGDLVFLMCVSNGILKGTSVLSPVFCCVFGWFIGRIEW